MRGPRLSRQILFFPLEIGETEEKIFTSADIGFSLKISVMTKKKRSLLMVMRPLIFYKAPRFL